ncbi:pre-rRNA-processing protein IPI3 [Fistulifera solaris]|uniref:Pre-rRNA-processing protein IPI3 n=1 Tax=Fistulifera solaris TaxID=1519565 RepID=A0A1Z5JYW1_FISSO|nr:pre-rRNA-processing protein IPI3 [Fistulifera solaris]|eukprot:GAX19233.1 pre-rRNA-processing protein IPI3 [Fistulifera solaris]
MSIPKKIICISTTKPTTSLTPGGGGGSLCMMCPYTGSVQSSLRLAGDMSGKVPLGVASVSTFPNHVMSTPNNTLAVAFGFTHKKDDSYALLFTLRSAAALPPILHWKCRLPESEMSAGLLISPCGAYIVAGGSSGTIYLWNVLEQSRLVRSFKAHYRSVAVMAFSGRDLVTGGDDGMIHAFSWIELISETTTNVQPWQTWTQHHLPVTGIKALGGGRIISCGQDGQVVLYEGFSGNVLACIQLNNPLHVLEVQDHNRLFVGSKSGMIHIIDTDEYALHKTAQMGASVKRQKLQSGSYAEQLFGREDKEKPYLMSLCGHDYPITALAIAKGDDDDHLLISGDGAGVVRTWSLASKSCVKVVEPWSHMGVDAQKKKNVISLHPVTSITVLNQDVSESTPLFTSTSQRQHAKKKETASQLIRLLQKHVVDEKKGMVAYYPPHSFVSWDVPNVVTPSFVKSSLARRRRSKAVLPTPSAETNSNEAEETIRKLRNELAEAKSTIERWETVNNKLMARLQG